MKPQKLSNRLYELNASISLNIGLNKRPSQNYMMTLNEEIGNIIKEIRALESNRMLCSQVRSEEQEFTMWEKEWMNANRFFTSQGSLAVRQRWKKKWFEEFLEMIR